MKKAIFVVLCINAFLLSGRFYQELDVLAQEEKCATKNGDVNGDDLLDISDAIRILAHLFLGATEPVPICNAQGGELTEEQREILSHMSMVQLSMGGDEQGNDLGTAKTIRFTGVNVQVVNGLWATNGFPQQPNSANPVQTVTNGVGNLIVGYQELRGARDDRTGSHNIVVATQHNYSSFGGLVVGHRNTISGVYSSVSGGFRNTASGDVSTVSGGDVNTASGGHSSVSGGGSNRAIGLGSSVSGGSDNTARGGHSSVSGGSFNTASGDFSTVSGGLSVTVQDEAGHAP